MTRTASATSHSHSRRLVPAPPSGGRPCRPPGGGRDQLLLTGRLSVRKARPPDAEAIS
ncbi:hypothetical protein [Streptomyces sp. KMM 9044]|uniref:hypothetical protein n=1 Tax=Streptomyces sp. KMM 9044 TaxID=2744474 RepID=UPI002151A40F|nr:hypothetical protein [Streptomyces sp. KMM 9044]WAX77667.1 hypothetical protein HUV60_008250 [Streptomyces sp. KMM 9044]